MVSRLFGLLSEYETQIKLNKAIVTNCQSWIDSMFRTRTKCSSNGNQWGLGCLRITLTLWAILPPVSPFLGPQIGTPTRNQNTVGLPLEVQMTGKQTQVLPVWFWGSSEYVFDSGAQASRCLVLGQRTKYWDLKNQTNPSSHKSPAKRDLYLT